MQGQVRLHKGYAMGCGVGAPSVIGLRVSLICITLESAYTLGGSCSSAFQSVVYRSGPGA